MKSIPVRLGDRSYHIEFGALQNLPKRLRRIGIAPTHVLVITSRAVASAGHLKNLSAALQRRKYSVSSVTIANGESEKNLKTLSGLYQQALKAGLDRKSVVIGLGGGVVTDLAGFLAASFMRGVAFVSVPTTILGMVDAAIGGKTGVDLPEGKNLVGAFWQPRIVWIDSSVLRTLPKREWHTGFAEIAKYGVIKSRPFFDWLEKKIGTQRDISQWSRADVERAIFESARIKASVVSGDERETPLGGGREILNFGHTIGHALEAAARYSSLSHGEAISVGMAAAGQMALELGSWSLDAQLQLLLLLEAAGLPVRIPEKLRLDRKKFWSALAKDKKHISGSLRFVLPVKVGHVRVQSGIPISLVRRTMHSFGME